MVVPSEGEEERERRVPAEDQALRLTAGLGRDHVADHEAGRAHQHRLRQRDHAAVGGEEDQARGGDAHDQRLREDDVDPVLVEDERRDDRQHQAADADHPLGDELLLVHENLPKSPCGRKASTSARSMNVNTIEYWVQQLLPAVGR